MSDLSDTIKELQNSVYELQLNNYDNDDDDGVVYQDTSYNQQSSYPDENQAYEPISPAAPLNIQSLPSFNNMGMNVVSAPKTTVFSRLGQKNPEPLQPLQPSFPQPSVPLFNQPPPPTSNVLVSQNIPTPATILPLAAPKFSFGGSPATGMTSKPVPIAAKSGPDVEVVYVKTPPQDLQQKAEDLKLSKSFYNYLDKPDCSGCRGCEPNTSVSATSTTATPISTTVTTTANVTPKPTVFGTPLTSNPLFGVKPANNNEAPKFSFGIASNEAKADSESTPVASESRPFSFSLGTSTPASEAPKFTFGFSATNPDTNENLFTSGSASSSFAWGATSEKPSWLVDKPSLIFGQKVCSPNEEDDEENPEEGMHGNRQIHH